MVIGIRMKSERSRNSNSRKNSNGCSINCKSQKTRADINRLKKRVRIIERRLNLPVRNSK